MSKVDDLEKRIKELEDTVAWMQRQISVQLFGPRQLPTIR